MDKEEQKGRDEKLFANNKKKKVILWLHRSRDCRVRWNGDIQCPQSSLNVIDSDRFQLFTFFPDILSLLYSEPASRPYVLSFTLPPDPRLLSTDRNFLPQDPRCSARPRGQTTHLTKQPWLCLVTCSVPQLSRAFSKSRIGHGDPEHILTDFTQAEQVKLLLAATISQKQ